MKVLPPASSSDKPPRVDEHADRLCDAESFQEGHRMIALCGTTRHFTHDRPCSPVGTDALLAKASLGTGRGECRRPFGAALSPEMGVFAPPSPFFKNK